MSEMLKIDEEFRTVLPPLTEDEFKQLEENILREGIINPIITWNGTIVDGHNRYAIVQKHPDVTFVTKEKEFSNRYEVIDWIITHQKGQRNLTDAQRTVLIGKLLEVRKLAHGENQVRNEDGTFRMCRNCTNGESDNKRSHNSRTSEEIGKEFGIAARTVDDAYAYHKGIEAIKEEDPTVANDILTGKVSVPKKVVQDIRKAEKPVIKETVKAIKDGTFKKPIRVKTPEEKQMIENIQKDVEITRTSTNYVPTVDDLVKEIRNNSAPYVTMLRNTIKGYADVIRGNTESVLEAIDKHIEEIEKLKEEIKNVYA